MGILRIHLMIYSPECNSKNKAYKSDTQPSSFINNRRRDNWNVGTTASLKLGCLLWNIDATNALNLTEHWVILRFLKNALKCGAFLN